MCDKNIIDLKNQNYEIKNQIKYNLHTNSYFDLQKMYLFHVWFMCACKCFIAPYNCILLISYVAFTMHTFMPAVLGAFIHEPGTHLIEYVFQYNWIVYPINSNGTTIRQWMVHCLLSWAIICLSSAGSIFVNHLWVIQKSMLCTFVMCDLWSG